MTDKYKSVWLGFLTTLVAILTIGYTNLNKNVLFTDSEDKLVAPITLDEEQNKAVDPDQLRLIASQLPLAIDRRPVRVVRCWTSNYTDNPLGLASWWADDGGIEELGNRLTVYYEMGYRRFMLNLPAGHPQNQRLMSSSQWLTMSDGRRELLLDKLPRWKADHPDTELYVYMGFAMADPHSLVMPARQFDHTPSITQNWGWFRDNLQGWIDCGVTGFGFDYASHREHVDAFIEVARVLSIAGIKCIGEAIPSVSQDDGGLMPAKEVTQAPFFALDQFIHQRDPDGRWRFDPRTTECGVGLKRSMRIAGQADRVRVTEDMIRDWVRRGLILYVYEDEWDGLALQLERGRVATDPDASDTGGVLVEDTHAHAPPSLRLPSQS